MILNLVSNRIIDYQKPNIILFVLRIQGTYKKRFPGCVKLGEKVAFCLPTAGRRTQFFHPIFTQPGKHSLEVPCTLMRHKIGNLDLCFIPFNQHYNITDHFSIFSRRMNHFLDLQSLIS